MSEDGESHFRLVTLGGSAVGKSSILKRFIFGNFCDKHRPTVEDLYSREYDIGTMLLKVTFLDTAGDMQFPAMRRLSITNGHAFLLVYSVDCEESFEIVKQCLEEIREQKPDFQNTPIMVVGNKCDLPDDVKTVKKEDVSEWLFCDLPRMRAKILECSAKDNTNIKDLFKTFLQLAKIPLPSETHPLRRRRSSAHVAIGRLTRFNSSLSPQRELHKQQQQQEQEESQEAEASQDSTAQQQQNSQKNSSKPRSKSLIRRTSRKLAKFKEATTNSSSNAPSGSGGDNECIVS